MMKHSKRFRAITLLLAAAICVLSAGCSGSGGEASGNEKSPSSAPSSVSSSVPAAESSTESSAPSELPTESSIEVVEPSITEDSSESESVPVSQPDREPSPSRASEIEPSHTKTYQPVPEEWQDDGIFSNYYEKAYQMVQDMTLEEKVGQVILARCPEEDGAAIAKEYCLGGYTLFGRDFRDHSSDEVIANISSYQSSQQIPMIIAVDEEGGIVTRVSCYEQFYHDNFPSPRELFNAGGMEKIQTDALEKAKLLRSLSINTNLAPVCDISTNPNDFMYERSLGQDPQVTAEFVRRVVSVSQENGISATLKHFPGYGSNRDTHNGIAIDKRTYETFVQNDFVPFQAGINAGAHCVMVSHNIVECLNDQLPASLSPEIHQVLRENLHFTGVIMTDDLIMDAVSVYVTDVSPVIAAVQAGNDMLCVSDISGTVEELIRGVHTGEIELSSIEHAAMRIIAWKMSKHLL